MPALGLVEGRRVPPVRVTWALHSFPREALELDASHRILSPQDAPPPPLIPAHAPPPHLDHWASPAVPWWDLSGDGCIRSGRPRCTLSPQTGSRGPQRRPSPRVSPSSALPSGTLRTCRPRQLPCGVGEGNSSRRGLPSPAPRMSVPEGGPQPPCFRRSLHLPCSLNSWSASTGSHHTLTPGAGTGSPAAL